MKKGAVPQITQLPRLPQARPSVGLGGRLRAWSRQHISVPLSTPWGSLPCYYTEPLASQSEDMWCLNISSMSRPNLRITFASETSLPRDRSLLHPEGPGAQRTRHQLTERSDTMAVWSHRDLKLNKIFLKIIVCPVF